MSLQIHWHEGLFLQPHHLQRFQKNVFDLVGHERAVTWSYPYGLIDSQIAQDDLENMRVRFDRLRAIMPSGLELDFPRNGDVPSIDIKQALSTNPTGVRIYLGVPIWLDGRANTMEPGQVVDARTKLIYRANEVSYTDENTGENAKPVVVRRINARLLLEHEDRSDMEVLPLLRVMRAAGEEVGMPRQDPDFVPPCLVTKASPVLRELLRDLASQVEASRAELQVQLGRSGFNLETLRGLQFEQLLRMRSLNRFAGTLPSLADAAAVAPFDMYLYLRELLGELCAMYPDREDFKVAPYNHDNPILCFRELVTKIRSYLRGAVAPSYIKVPFVKGEDGLLAAAMTDEHFTLPSDYFLGIKTKEDPRTLSAFVEDADGFKLMPRSLAMRAIWGVKLKEERFQPLELPAQADMRYFRLLRGESQRVWGQLQQEKSAIIRWIGKEDADYDIALYMTVSQGN